MIIVQHVMEEVNLIKIVNRAIVVIINGFTNKDAEITAQTKSLRVVHGLTQEGSIHLGLFAICAINPALGVRSQLGTVILVLLEVITLSMIRLSAIQDFHME